MKPDICTSLNCNNMGCDCCQKCSHAIFSGEGKDRNGKIWRWEFSPQFGPLFVGKRGNSLKNQPIMPWHRAWEPFETWLKKRRLF